MDQQHTAGKRCQRDLGSTVPWLPLEANAMNSTPGFRHAPLRFLRTVVSVAASLFLYGALAMPAVIVSAQAVPAPSPAPAAPAAVPASATSVSVAQQPLTLQPAVPPNLVLMLDDSGSMGADYMPDFSYLKNPGNNDALIDAANNGVYYNPAVTYTPPPKADSTAAVPNLYPAQTDMTKVPQDGFSAQNPGVVVNLYTYDGSYECDDGGNCGDGSHGSGRGGIAFNVSATSTTGPQQAYSQVVNWNGSKLHPVYADAVCANIYASYSTASNYAFTGLTKSNGNWTSGNCTFTYRASVYFQYSTGSAAGPYAVYYVASAGQGCGTQVNCVLDSDTSGAAAPKGIAAGQNIANWFAYYHTRILMAKSGLMTAYSTLDPNFRVGFGSINDKNSGGLPSPTYGSSHIIADVAVFGNGTSGTQKANFWNWIAGVKPGSSTPLRAALAAVGQYYQTDQPWTNMASDPQFGTNNPYSAASPGSPLQCRQAYTILTTDGFWNGNYSSSTTQGASDTGGPTNVGPNQQSYTYSPVAPYSGGDAVDNSGNPTPSLADVAMYYWKTDLQTGLKNEVPPNAADPAFWQHMVTFTMGLGFTPENITGTGPAPNNNNPPTTQDIANWANDGGGAGSKFAITDFAWPQPQGGGDSGGSINNIADLEHAGVNGHGGFFSATDPQSFTSGLQAALKRATERVGTGASLAANSTSLNTGTVIYQANYFTAIWTGDLKALAVNAATGAIATSPTWTASGSLPASTARNIQTWNGTAFVPFANNGGTPPSLSSAQAVALGGGSSGSTTAETNMVAYLRGNPTLEQKNPGGTFRSRDTPLGDIVNSQPVYSGAPDAREFISQSFFGYDSPLISGVPAFYAWAVGTTDSNGNFQPSAASQRTPLIFAAANDGMLHAFNAQSGAEVFAYLPGAVITAGLANLANPAYGSVADPHQFYNDGQLTVADAYVALAQEGETTPSWHTILVGTTGRGTAKAVYALDVTNPGSITPLWERSAGDGLTNAQYIGQMTGKPIIAQTSASATSSGWSVLIGNGYNSTAGVSALLQFDLATGALSVHTTSDPCTTGCNGAGLAAPVAWMNYPNSGVSDVAYAGDLDGNVWSFQLSSVSTNKSTGATTFTATPSSAGTLLFTARDSGNKRQPITAGMLAGKDPTSLATWLFFGTGRYMAASDLTDTSTQTWYGIIVQSGTNAPAVTSTTTRTTMNNGQLALVQRTITGQTGGGGGVLPARTVSLMKPPSGSTSDMTGASGWYMDLLAPVGVNNALVPQGERMVVPNQFQGSLLLGVTLVPQVTDVCNPSGSGWIMALMPFTGTAPSGDFFDTNGDGYVNSGDRTGGQVTAGVGFGSLPNAPIFVGGVMETSFDNGTTASLRTSGTVGVMQRVSWREVVGQ